MFVVLFLLFSVKQVATNESATNTQIGSMVQIVGQLYQSIEKLQNDESLLKIEAEKVVADSVEILLAFHPNLKSDADLLVASVSRELTEVFRLVSDDMYIWVNAGDDVLAKVKDILNMKEYEVDNIVDAFLSSPKFLQMVMKCLLDCTTYVNKRMDDIQESDIYAYMH